MPVELELITQPSQQDAIDLEKVYADYPEPLPSETLDWLAAQTQAGQQLVGARFNARLLGALLLTEHEGAWSIDHLCIRKVTRRRGVARQLLLQLQQLATREHRHLTFDRPASAEFAPLLQELDFHQQGERWIWKALGE